MSFAIEVLGYGGLFPAAIAIAMPALVRRWLPPAIAEPYAAAIGFAVAFFVGYTLLPVWAPLIPQHDWHWLPYLGAAAMVAGPMGTTRGTSAAWRGLVQLALAMLAAWLLVPTWVTLHPPRSICIPLLAGYLLLLTALMDRLPARVHGPTFQTLLLLVAANVAVMAMVFVSETYGRVAGIAAAATAGCSAASWFHDSTTSTRGLVPAFTLVVAGTSFIACVYPQSPLVGMLLVPASPLALWLCACGPLARLNGPAAAAAQSIAALVPLAVAWLLVIGG